MIHMIGNAHIDPVWFWNWREGYHEVKASFQSALDRISESDDFVFTAACADYYRWVEENAPDMFEQIKTRIQQGRWRIVGGMWVQPDCNMPSGEAFARHFLYSQRYFKEKFGIIATTGYNVDSFGHTHMLPALLSNAGIKNYVFLRPDVKENPSIPYPLFKWISPDGSSVNAFRIIDGYGSRFGSVEEDINRALEMQEKMNYPVMCFYGVGNHGGGPTIKNIASIHDYQQNGAQGDQVIFSDPDSYFDQIKELGIEPPEWNNELQHHASGCYSATSMIKRLNREVENSLVRSEKFMSLSNKLTGHTPKQLNQGWYNLIFNQFHDVLCGCSVQSAYKDAEFQLHESVSIAEREENAALQKISWRVDTVNGIPERLRSKESHFALWELDGLGTPVVVFNPHAFEVETAIQVYGGIARATDDQDNPIPVQVVRAGRTNGSDKWDSVFMAKVPAFGYRLYWMYLAEEGQSTEAGSYKSRTQEDNGRQLIEASGLHITEHSLENKNISVRFDPQTGAVVSLINKKSSRETLSKPAFPTLVDIEHVDTWAHGVFTFDKLVEKFENAHFQILEEGPVRAKLRVTTSAKASTLVQDYILYADGDQLEVDARLDMQENFRMLKLCFPTVFEQPMAHAEISYGAIEREPDGCEETGHRWMQVGNAIGGLALLNDSKYSFSVVDSEIRLTVANTSIYADHYGQENRDNQVMHADIGWQSFRYALVPHEGSWKTASLNRRGEVFNMALPHVIETYHKGDLPGKLEGLSVDASNISIGAIKRAEDENGYVLRILETTGQATQALIKAPLFYREFQLQFTPMEIKTLLLPDNPEKSIQEMLFTEWEK